MDLCNYDGNPHNEHSDNFAESGVFGVEKNVTYSKSAESDPNIFHQYSANIDVDAIWKTNKSAKIVQTSSRIKNYMKENDVSLWKAETISRNLNQCGKPIDKRPSWVPPIITEKPSNPRGDWFSKSVPTVSVWESTLPVSSTGNIHSVNIVPERILPNAGPVVGGAHVAIDRDCSVDSGTISATRMKSLEGEIADHQWYVASRSRLLEQQEKSLRRVQEVDRSILAVGRSIPEVQRRPVMAELLHQRETAIQRGALVRGELAVVARRLREIEARLGSAPDPRRPRVVFRADVPEFVPGRRWGGLEEPGVEACGWLLVERLPEHVSPAMLQGLLARHGAPCLPPVHRHPFSRWLLARFQGRAGARAALSLLAGKVGTASLVSEEQAQARIRDLDGAIAQLVAR